MGATHSIQSDSHAIFMPKKLTNQLKNVTLIPEQKP